MAQPYIVHRYQTGIQESVIAAADLLDAKAATFDPTTNVLIGRDILLLGRDSQRCIGWALFTGAQFQEADHDLVSDNIDLAQHFTRPAASDHLHAADALTITTNP